jgi:hypothetical protein
MESHDLVSMFDGHINKGQIVEAHLLGRVLASREDAIAKAFYTENKSFLNKI